MNAQKKESFLVAYSDKVAGDIFRSALLDHFPNSRIIESQDGSDLLRKIAFEKFSVLILDIDTSKRESSNLLKELLAFNASIQPDKILIFCDRKESESVFLSNKRVTCLVKPLPVEDFIEAVYKSLGFGLDSKLDNQLINDVVPIFVQASVHFLSNIVGVEIEEIFEGEKNSMPREKMVVAAFPVRGDAIKGYLKFVASQTTSTGLNQIYLDRANSKSLEFKIGVMGELCNATFGIVQKALMQQGYQAEANIPVVTEQLGTASNFDLSGALCIRSLKTKIGNIDLHLTLRARK